MSEITELHKRKTGKRPKHLAGCMRDYREASSSNGTGIIYAIVSLATRSIYIGSSYRYQQRFPLHMRLLREGRHHAKLLQAEFDEHGADRFICVPIQQGFDVRLMLFYEQAWINRIGSRLLNAKLNVCKDSERVVRERMRLDDEQVTQRLRLSECSIEDLINELEKRDVEVKGVRAECAGREGWQRRFEPFR